MRLENSFILAPGIGEKTEKKLWKRGITRWEDLSGSEFISKSRREGIENFLCKARKNLEAGNSYFFGDKLPSKSLWRSYRNFESDACFFDIETTGLDRKNNRVTTVSFHRSGETVTLVRGRDLNRERIKQEIRKSSILVSFNGKRFDQPFLEQSFDLNIDVPHLDLMYTCKRLGFSGGLKNIEKQLDISRKVEDVDGREAVRLWKKYEKGDEKALEKLVKYNRYDARNLKDVLEDVHSRLKSKVFKPHVS